MANHPDPAEEVQRLASAPHLNSPVSDVATVIWARQQAELPASEAGYAARLHEYDDAGRTALDLVIEEDRSSHGGRGPKQSARFAVSRDALLANSPDATVTLYEVNNAEVEETGSLELPERVREALRETHARLSPVPG